MDIFRQLNKLVETVTLETQSNDTSCWTEVARKSKYTPKF